MNFMTGLPISIDWKGDNYNSILVIVNWLTKMVYYKLVKIKIDAPELAEVIIDLVMYYHGLSNSIVIDKNSFFTLKFWSSFCYFFDIKCQLSTAFHLQING